MNDTLTVHKMASRFMRDAEKQAIERVNNAVPAAEALIKIDSARAAKVSAIRRNIGIRRNVGNVSDEA